VANLRPEGHPIAACLQTLGQQHEVAPGLRKRDKRVRLYETKADVTEHESNLDRRHDIRRQQVEGLGSGDGGGDITEIRRIGERERGGRYGRRDRESVQRKATALCPTVA
jgi:hypothetical protein